MEPVEIRNNLCENKNTNNGFFFWVHKSQGIMGSCTTVKLSENINSTLNTRIIVFTTIILYTPSYKVLTILFLYFQFVYLHYHIENLHGWTTLQRMKQPRETGTQERGNQRHPRTRRCVSTGIDDFSEKGFRRRKHVT